MTSWLSIPPDSDFTLANIPLGIFTRRSSPASPPSAATIIGTHLIDLAALAAHNGFSNLPLVQPHLAVFSSPTLNAYAALGRALHTAVRHYLQSLLTAGGPHASLLELRPEIREHVVVPEAGAEMHLPMLVGDYTDFYAGRVHAYNVGCLFRGPDNALQRNYEYLPVGYHGRASSVVVSGTEVRRPWGQVVGKEGEVEMVPTRRLDIEVEMAVFVATGNQLGTPVKVVEAEERVFGYVLMNDWSARDIQSFEYVPLGPFTSKNFLTTITPWVVSPLALAPYHAPTLSRTIPLPPHLSPAGEVPSLNLTATINSHPITRTNSKNLLWSFPQMLAHHTVSGCNLRTGDLLGSGTISGPEPGEAGCLLEATGGGKTAVVLGGDQSRMWLEDGDEVAITGHCGEGAERVGWGEGGCRGTVLPAVTLA